MQITLPRFDSGASGDWRMSNTFYESEEWTVTPEVRTKLKGVKLKLKVVTAITDATPHEEASDASSSTNHRHIHMHSHSTLRSIPNVSMAWRILRMKDHRLVKRAVYHIYNMGVMRVNDRNFYVPTP